MLIFNEIKLKEKLAGMPSLCRLTFAVAVANRQLASYERYAEFKPGLPLGRPREIIADLFLKIDSGNLSINGWPEVLDEVMNLIPEEDTSYAGFLDLMAQHGLSSLAYAIRYLLSGDPQESAWAGLCEYEAADQAAIKTLNVDLEAPEAETKIARHRFVQQMLQAQYADLELLETGQVWDVLKRSEENPTFSEQELHTFA